jgi:amidase
MKDDLHYWNATKLAAAIRARHVSSVEAIGHFEARFDRFNAAINAIVVVDFDAARAEAHKADADLAAGRLRGPLHGVPMTMKESFNIAGFPTTWGLKENLGWVPDRDGMSARRFREAGAIIFGKTNVPAALTDLDTFNEVYGVTNNPYDHACIPGGSSGGSAAALAAGLTALEAGSDSGSSIRYPAHYCGVYGHKSTWGIVSMQGETVGERLGRNDISVAGPMARSAEDLALALRIQAGPDDSDAAGWRLDLVQAREKTLSQHRIAILSSHPVAPVDHDTSRCIAELSRFLRKSGAVVDHQALPMFDLEDAQEKFVLLMAAGRGLRIGEDKLREVRGKAAGSRPESYAALRAAGLDISHREWLGIDEYRHRIRTRWRDFFQSYDFLICPVAQTAAFPHVFGGEWFERDIVVDGQRHPLANQLFWAGLASLSYLPATAIPIGRSAGGLPIGVQVIGPQFADQDCIAFAQLLEHAFYAFSPPAGY